MDIIFSEGPLNMNWTVVLKNIRGDLESFINDEGWDFLA